MPANISTVDFTNSVYLLFKYSDIKIDDNTPIGVAIITAIVVINNVPVRRGIIPRLLAYFMVFCGFQSSPNRKFCRGTRLKNFSVSVSNSITINIIIEQVRAVSSSSRNLMALSKIGRM